jgi:DNA ligase (NAD+)
MRELAAEITRHDRLYYVEDDPEISDADYDRLLRELRTLEQAHPELRAPDSPTRRVGAPPAEGFATAVHRVPMLSLDNAMDESEMRAFDERVRRALDRSGAVRWLGEPKLDGASLELVYEDGELAVAATRGDGRLGEDVTANVRQVPSVPLSIEGDAARGRVSVRGEVLLPLANFSSVEPIEPVLLANLDASCAISEATRSRSLVASSPDFRMSLTAVFSFSCAFSAAS